MTKVFISWSKPTSHAIAKLLSAWLPDVLQDVETFFSPEDIDPGVEWADKLKEALEGSQIGIICLTSENRLEQWPIYEAGRLTGKVITLLIGVSRPTCPILSRPIKPLPPPRSSSSCRQTSWS